MDSLTTHRVSWSCYEIIREGSSVEIHSDECIPGLPHVFSNIERLYAAAKGAHGAARVKDEDGE